MSKTDKNMARLFALLVWPVNRTRRATLVKLRREQGIAATFDEPSPALYLGGKHKK
jgi:hypothetical protein